MPRSEQKTPCLDQQDIERFVHRRADMATPDQRRFLRHLNDCDTCLNRATGLLADLLGRDREALRAKYVDVVDGITPFDLFRRLQGTYEKQVAQSDAQAKSQAETTHRETSVEATLAHAADDPATAPQTPGDVGNLGDDSVPQVQAYGNVDAWFLGPPIDDGDLGSLGGYRIQRVLGRGGMGVIYAGHDPKLQRQVALKVMLPEIAQREESRTRFLREARAVARIHHENVVTLFEVGEHRGLPFIAMPLLRGNTFGRWVRGEASPSMVEQLEVFIQIGRGLSAAHRKGIIHRDIKPDNIFVCQTEDHESDGCRWRVKLLDFGLVRECEADMTLTKTGVMMGTPAFMSPEQSMAKELDIKSDLFSFASVMYFAATGRSPFKGESIGATIANLQSGKFESLSKLKQLSFPKSFARLVEKSLATEPEKRPPSADAMIQELRGVLKELRQPPPPPKRIALWDRIRGIFNPAVDVPSVRDQPRWKGESASDVPPVSSRDQRKATSKRWRSSAQSLPRWAWILAVGIPLLSIALLIGSVIGSVIGVRGLFELTVGAQSNQSDASEQDSPIVPESDADRTGDRSAGSTASLDRLTKDSETPTEDSDLETASSVDDSGMTNSDSKVISVDRTIRVDTSQLDVGTLDDDGGRLDDLFGAPQASRTVPKKSLSDTRKQQTVDPIVDDSSNPFFVDDDDGWDSVTDDPEAQPTKSQTPKTQPPKTGQRAADIKTTRAALPFRFDGVDDQQHIRTKTLGRKPVVVEMVVKPNVRSKSMLLARISVLRAKTKTKLATGELYADPPPSPYNPARYRFTMTVDSASGEQGAQFFGASQVMFVNVKEFKQESIRIRFGDRKTELFLGDRVAGVGMFSLPTDRRGISLDIGLGCRSDGNDRFRGDVEQIAVYDGYKPSTSISKGLQNANRQAFFRPEQFQTTWTDLSGNLGPIEVYDADHNHAPLPAVDK